MKCAKCIENKSWFPRDVCYSFITQLTSAHRIVQYLCLEHFNEQYSGINPGRWAKVERTYGTFTDKQIKKLEDDYRKQR